MTDTVEKLQAEVLNLSRADRTRLLDRLVASLDHDAEIEQEWDDLADARASELASGAARGIPLEVVVAALEARYPG